MNELRILIVGGYGAFGTRIVELLQDEPRLTLIVAGRSLQKARALCESYASARARLVPAHFDRDGDIDVDLASHGPHILVDASGPFQSYGKQPYRLAELCLARGIHYLDLADGSDFVAGIGALDDAARAAGVYVLSGASTFPVLSHAVVSRLAENMAVVDSIHGGIAPSPYARVGGNVIRAIAGYAGKPVVLKRNGQWEKAYPFTEQMHFTIAPPGTAPLERRLFSLVDVPDLRSMPLKWTNAKTVWMGAAPVPEVLHRALIALAWLTRWRIVRSLSPLAPLMSFATNHFRWGRHRGGMFIAVEGADAAGTRLRRSWHLVAEKDAGPLIPSMAVEAIVRRTLAGAAPAPGARAAAGEVTLAEYETLFARQGIVTGIRGVPVRDTSLYRRVLGDSWNHLPRQIQLMHDLDRDACAEGRATVERGRGSMANMIANMFGFPKAGQDIPLTVRFKIAAGHEVWTRNFAGRSFSSAQFRGSRRYDGLLCERFGLLTFGIALVTGGGRLSLLPRGWTLLGIPMPMRLCPRVNAFEAVEDDRFRFFVELGLPGLGLLVRYRGWLGPPRLA